MLKNQLTRKEIEDGIYQKVDSLPLPFLESLDSIVLGNINPSDPKDDIIKEIQKLSDTRIEVVWYHIHDITGKVDLLEELIWILQVTQRIPKLEQLKKNSETKKVPNPQGTFTCV